jgi:hypothetical protein
MSMEGNTRVYESKTDNQTVFFAFIDKNSAVLAGARANVVNAINAANSNGKGPKLSKEMTGLLTKVDGKQSVWLAALAPEEMKKALAGIPQTAELADKILAFSGGVTVDKDLALGLAIHASDAKAAESIAEHVDTGAGLLRVAVKGEDVAKQLGKETALTLANLVDGIKIGSTKETATVNLKISDDSIQKLMKAVPQPKKP